MTGVALGHLQQAVLLATLRAVQAAHAPPLARQPLPHHVRIRQLDRKVDLMGDVGRLIVVTLNEAGCQLDLIDVEALVQDKLAGSLHAPLAHDEHASTGDGLLTIEADEVQIHARGKHNLLTIVQPVDNLKATFDAPRTLEIEIGGSLGHIGFKLIDELAALPG